MGKSSRKKGYYERHRIGQDIYCDALMIDGVTPCTVKWSAKDIITMEVLEAHFEISHPQYENPTLRIGKRRLPLQDVVLETTIEAPPKRRAKEPDREDVCTCGHYRWQHQRVTFPNSTRRDFLECTFHVSVPFTLQDGSVGEDELACHTCSQFKLDLAKTHRSRKHRESGT